MKKPLLLVFIFSCFYQFTSAQIVNETFEDATMPVGWFTTINTGTCSWSTFTSNAPHGPDFSSTALIFDDDDCGEFSESSNVSLTTDTYDISGVDPVLLTVEIGMAGVGGEKLSIEVYDGTQWQIILQLQTGQDRKPFYYYKDVTPFANADFKVRFTYDDNGQWGWYAGIDNFKLTQESNTHLNPQDKCETAPSITAGSHTAEDIQAGFAPNSCYTNNDAAGAAWFKYTAATTGSAIVTTDLNVNPDLDTRISIFSGTCGALNCIGFNDDVDENFRSEAFFPITAGEEYFIVFDDYWDSRGFEFEITEDDFECSTNELIAFDFSDEQTFQICHTQQDVDGDGSIWVSDHGPVGNNSEDHYFVVLETAQQPSNDYLYSPALTLTGGSTYYINFSFNVLDYDDYIANESIEVFMAGAPNSTSSISTLYNETGIAQNFDPLEGNTLQGSARQIKNLEFTPSSTGEYYIGFHRYSPANSGYVFFFDYSVEKSLGTENMTTPITRYYDTYAKKLIVNSQSTIDEVRIYNLMGQEMIAQKNLKSKAEIDFSTFPQGVYIAQITANDRVENFKVLKN